MYITLTIQLNNKQGVWLSISGFFKTMNCQLEIKNIIEQGEQRIVTVAVVSQKLLTEDDILRLENFSEDVLSVKVGGSGPPIIKKAANIPNSTLGTTPTINAPTKPSGQGSTKQKKARTTALVNDKTEANSTLNSHRTGSLQLMVSALIVLLAIGAYFGTRQKDNQPVLELVDARQQTDILNDQQELEPIEPLEAKAKTEIVDQHTDTALVQEKLYEAAQQRQKALSKNQLVNQRNDKITKLLAQAKIAFKAQHYSKPTHDNAIKHYRQVLALDSRNRVAKLGLKKIASRYREMAKDVLADNFKASRLHDPEGHMP